MRSISEVWNMKQYLSVSVWGVLLCAGICGVAEGGVEEFTFYDGQGFFFWRLSYNWLYWWSIFSRSLSE